MRNSQKGSIPLIISVVIIILIMGAVMYYYSQKSQDTKVESDTQATSTAQTTDLKIYKNTKYGFEFKYPENLEISSYDNNPEISSDDNIGVGVWEKGKKGGENKYSRFSVSAIPLDEGARYITPNYNQGDCSSCITSWKPTTLSGYSGYEVKQGGEGGEHTYLAIKKSNNIFLISHKQSFNPDIDDLVEYQNDSKIRESIFATFKFSN